MAGFWNLAYERFLMRDLLGKFTPGFIVVISLMYILAPKQLPFPLFKELAWLYWIAAFAACHSVGVGMQVVGEWLGLFWMAPLPKQLLILYNAKFPFIRDLNFMQSAKMTGAYEDSVQRDSMIMTAKDGELPTSAREQRERYVYLKEATGNMALALLVTAVMTKSLTLLIIVAGLWVSHLVYAGRQGIHETVILEEAKLFVDTEEAVKMWRNIPIWSH